MTCAVLFADGTTLGLGGVERGEDPFHRLTTFTCDIALISETNSVCLASNPGEAGPSGFATTVRAPAAVASRERFTAELDVAEVTITIGAGARDMICRVASSPSIPGMYTSIVISDGRIRWAASTAASPLAACPTTMIPGSLSSIAETRAREVAESSTTRTRIGSVISVEKLLNGLEQRPLVETRLADVRVRSCFESFRAVLLFLQRCDEHHARARETRRAPDRRA